MIEVLAPGIYTSIQDSGREGYYSSGIPKTGFMDRQSAQLANLILNNKPDATLLELTAQGPVLEFHKDTHIAITGAIVSPLLNDKHEIPMFKAVSIKKGDVLTLGFTFIGSYTYLAVEGGILSPNVFGSQSMSRSVTKFFRLRRGNKLNFVPKSDDYEHGVSIKLNTDILLKKEVEVFVGADFGGLSDKQVDILFNTEYSVLNSSNRGAYAIHPLLKNNLKPILSVPVLPGTVQVTPSGKLFVLMRNCQTSGGYPRILQLSEDGINVLAQKQANSKFKFKLIDF